MAKSPDGIIEGTDTTDPNRFLIGLQGHPKKLMPEDNLNEKLIQAFIDSSPEGKK